MTTRAERIAVVCPRFSAEGTVGGAETLLHRLAERLAGQDRRVTVLTTCAQDHFTWKNTLPPGRRTIGPLTVHSFPVDEDRDLERFLDVQDRISRGETVSDDDERAWIDHNVNSAALCAHLREDAGAYDRILMGPYLFGLIWHAAQVHPERTLLVPCLHDEPFARLRIMGELFGAVRGLLFNTAPEQALAARLYGPAMARGRVVGMGLEPFEADPAVFARRRGIARPYLLYAGRRETLKGTPMLTDFVDAFRRRTGRDVMLVFTGSGPIEAPPGLLPHILDAGFVSEQEKHEAMAGAVAFVHPSALESLGIVVLESWLAGTPCLVSAHGEVLRHQCRESGGGLWFRTYPEFEEELLLLLDQPALRDALGRAGRAYVLREYSWDAVDRRLFAAVDA
jgi:glycosyltransferase involved in cell wall biosynthesis